MQELATHIFDNVVRKPTTETTGSANIAYLPGGFTKVSDALKTLARMKDIWNIKVLEADDKYVVSFEGKVRVDIQKPDFSTFLKEVLNLDELKTSVSLGKYLVEAQQDKITQAQSDLSSTLEQLIGEEPVAGLDYSITTFQKIFGTGVDATGPRTLLNLFSVGTYMKIVSGLETELESYEADVGQIESITYALKNREPLGGYPVFTNYDFFAGARIVARFKRVRLVFEAALDMNWLQRESLLVSDQELVDYVVENEPSVKAVKNVLFPKGIAFTESFLKSLKKDILVDAPREGKDERSKETE